MQYTQNSKPNPIWTCFHSLANDLAGLGLEQSLRWAEAGPNLDFLLSCIYNFEVMRVYSGTEELLHFTIVAVNGAHASYQKELGWLWLSWIGPEGVLSLIVWVGVRWEFETVVKNNVINLELKKIKKKITVTYKFVRALMIWQTSKSQ